MADLKNTVEESFARYAGNVILDRAICDVRDMLKPSARMLMYSQLHITKNTSSKSFVKSARVVGDCLGHYYTHGDGSCYSTYMRMAKPFAMRYPLEDCQGNSGTITETGDEAHMRYTELRMSKLGDQLFFDIDKETIQEWYDNFDETDKYPKVLPSKGFYNIVNGSTGIGVSLSASIPQFNIKDINNALIELIDNPNYEIDILPDFATGGILINPNEVKESLKTGTGFACKLRSVVEFDSKERAFIVKELPYGVYTNTISEQITKLVENNPDCGIDHINDGSSKVPDYMIYLTKKANPDKVLKLLYKETSLQSYFTINMNVLVDNGKKPKTLGLKEMLQAHINHEREVYRRGFEYDLRKIENRIHIIDGLLICLARIDEVVSTIKSSTSTAAASIALQQNFLLDAEQAKAVLDMKLSRLAHLEVKKLEDERTELIGKAEEIHKILNNEELFKEELKNGWREVSKKFGDDRRTKIMQLSAKNDSGPIEEKQLSLSFTNKGAVFVTETSTLYAQKRNGVGAKFKLENDEFIVDNLIGENTDQILFFTSHGNYYHMKMGDFVVGEKQFLNNLVTLLPYETVKNATVVSKTCPKNYIIFVTKNGIIKKSELSEYNMKRNVGATAITLDKDDEIVGVLFTNDEEIGMLSSKSYFIMIETSLIRPIGRVARGVIGMKLGDGDSVVSARIIPKNTKELLSISEKGYSKRTDITEFKITGRGTKGVKIQKEEILCDFLPIVDNSDILVSSTSAQIRVKLDDFAKSGRGAQGTKTIKLTETSKVIGISKF